MNNWKDNKSDNIDNLYSTFKKFINIDNYNKHIFYNPTEFKIFILPKSEFQKYKKYSNQNEITTDQYTEQFFNGILDKIIDRLNSDSGYKLLKLGLDAFKEKSTFFLLLCRAITMQLSQMVYDGSYNEKLTSASFSSSNGSAGFNASNDGFWYTQPHDILRNIGVIGTFGQPSEFDPNDIDFEFVASREWTLEQLEALEKQVIITLTDMETQINNFQNEVNNRLNDFDTLKADKEDLAKLVLPDGTGNKTIKNVKLSGNLVSQNIIDNPDGSVSVYADFSVGGSVDEALVVDDMTTEIEDNHQSQTPSYNIFRGVNDRVSTLEEEVSTLEEEVSTLEEEVSTLEEEIANKKGDTLCTWTGNLNQLSQAADMISFLENNRSKIIDIRVNTGLAFDKLFGSGDKGRVAIEEVMMGWKIRMNDNFINIICECEENFKYGNNFSKTTVKFYFTIDRGNNWCGLLAANGWDARPVEINDGVYLPNEDLTGYEGFYAFDSGELPFNILSNADDATLNEHFLITFKYFNDTEFEVPPYEPQTNKQTKEIKIDPYKNDTYEEYVIKKEKSVLEKLKELNDFLEGDK
jgi:peptidoglycan hydrolase CwlO-like protein